MWVHDASSQGLLDALNEVVEEPTLPVSATFKDTRIVNVQSNETPAEGVLHFVIAQTNVSNAQRTPCKGATTCCSDGILLIIDQFFQTPYSEITKFFHLIKRTDLTNVDGRQNTQSNLTCIIIDVIDGICRESDLLTQVGHINLVLEGGVGVAVVDIHNVNTTSLSTFLQKIEDQFLGTDCLTGNGLIFLVSGV